MKLPGQCSSAQPPQYTHTIWHLGISLKDAWSWPNSTCSNSSSKGIVLPFRIPLTRIHGPISGLLYKIGELCCPSRCGNPKFLRHPVHPLSSTLPQRVVLLPAGSVMVLGSRLPSLFCHKLICWVSLSKSVAHLGTSVFPSVQ